MSMVYIVFKKYLNHWAIDKVYRKKDKAFEQAAKIREEQEESHAPVIGSYVQMFEVGGD